MSRGLLVEELELVGCVLAEAHRVRLHAKAGPDVAAGTSTGITRTAARSPRMGRIARMALIERALPPVRCRCLRRDILVAQHRLAVLSSTNPTGSDRPATVPLQQKT